MRILILLLILSFGTAEAQDKLLDKIVAVVNSRVMTLSELKRMKETFAAREEISPFIYSKRKQDNSNLLTLMIESYIVRDKINQQGYVVSDDDVESRIKMTEQRLGLNRDNLLQFLDSKGITYEEYFEVIREAMEYNIFASRIIAPLISVTEQELKNEFYKRNVSNKALAFTYDVVDFVLPAALFKNESTSRFVQILKDYQLTGRLPDVYSGLESNALEGLREDGLHKSLAAVLENTPEGEFTAPVELSDQLHVLYVKKKDLVESAAFLKAKANLENEIFNEKSGSLTRNWFEREYENYYIKKHL